MPKPETAVPHEPLDGCHMDASVWHTEQKNIPLMRGCWHKYIDIFVYYGTVRNMFDHCYNRA